MADDVLLQMITQNDQKHEEGHRRLRQSLNDLADRIESNFAYLKDTALANRSRLDLIEKTAAMPVDAAKLVLSPRVVVAIVAAAITLAGGIWASTSGLRSDVRDILTRMDAQKEVYTATTKAQEAQSSAVKTSIDEMKRRQELQQYEIQQLKEAILTLKPR